MSGGSIKYSYPPTIPGDVLCSNINSFGINLCGPLLADQVVNHKNYVRQLQQATITTASNVVYTAAQLFGGLILRNTNGAPRTDTTDTAVNIVSIVPYAAETNSFEITISNTGSNIITLLGGAGVTLAGTITIPINVNITILVVLTNITKNSEAVTIYSYAVGGSGSGSGSGITTLNTLTASIQTLVPGTSGTDFLINSSGSIHTFNIPSSSAANRGLLTSADWTTFNNKLTGTLNSAQIFVGSAGNFATGVTMSGDASLNNAGVLTLTPTAVTPGTYGDSTNVSQFIVDQKGRLTSAIAVPIQVATGLLPGLVSIGSQTFGGMKTFSGILNATSGTPSTSTTTGALVVTGGIGSSGSLFVGGNANAVNLIPGLTSTVSAAGTTTLTIASSYIQQLTGVTTQTYQLPVATTLANGTTYEFLNDSTGILTINNATPTLVTTIIAGLRSLVVLTNNGTAAGVWDVISTDGVPGGSNTQFQYNNSGVFAGAAALKYFDATTLEVLNTIQNVAINTLTIKTIDEVTAQLLTIKAGTSTTATGGALTLTSGNSATGAGGALNITGGLTTAGTAGGGSVTVAGGVSFGGIGGNVNINAGTGTTSGDVNITSYGFTKKWPQTQGTSGQVLTVNPALNTLSWTTVSSGTTVPSFVQYTASASVTFPSNGSPVLWDTLLVNSGTITYLAGVFTLPANKNYNLSAFLINDTNLSAVTPVFRWRNITTATLIGNSGTQLSVYPASIQYGASSPAEAFIVSSASATTVRLEIISGGGIGVCLAGFSSVTIQSF